MSGIEQKLKTVLEGYATFLRERELVLRDRTWRCGEASKTSNK